MQDTGRPPLPFERIRPVVSHGTVGLLQVGFGIGPDDPTFPELRERLLTLYRESLADRTRPFPGITDLLAQIERRKLKWGVVTNKPGSLTEPLLAALGLYRRAATVVSGDTLAQRKPHAAPMLLACRQAGCGPSECVYVGDAARDIEAGRNAGMRTLAALFGYLGDEEDPRGWGADALIAHPRDVLTWLDGETQEKCTNRLQADCTDHPK